jgi:hypothetical protein
MYCRLLQIMWIELQPVIGSPGVLAHSANPKQWSRGSCPASITCVTLGPRINSISCMAAAGMCHGLFFLLASAQKQSMLLRLARSGPAGV